MAVAKVGDQFNGLDMAELIGGPLTAACNSQIMLANATLNFIKQVGFYPEDKDSKKSGETRTVDFAFERNVITGVDELGHDVYDQERVSLSVPTLAVVNVPSLMVDTVDINFNMTVTNSETHKDSIKASVGNETKAQVHGGALLWGASGSTTIKGRVTTTNSNIRKSDNSAKYSVAVKATQSGMPEGLARVLDIVAEAVAPTSIVSSQARKDEENDKIPDLAEKQKGNIKELKKLELDKDVSVNNIKTLKETNKEEADILAEQKKIDDYNIEIANKKQEIVATESEIEKARLDGN